MPLYGDMVVRPIQFLKESPHFDKSKWTASLEALEEQNGASMYNILTKLDTFRDERDMFICTLALCTSKVSQSSEE